MKPAEYYICLPMPTSTVAFGDGYRVDVLHWPGCSAKGATVDAAEAALRPAMAAYVHGLIDKDKEPFLPPFGDFPDLNAASLAFQAGLNLGRRQGIAATVKKYKLKPQPKTPETAPDESDPSSTSAEQK